MAATLACGRYTPQLRGVPALAPMNYLKGLIEHPGLGTLPAHVGPGLSSMGAGLAEAEPSLC